MCPRLSTHDHSSNIYKRHSQPKSAGHAPEQGAQSRTLKDGRSLMSQKPSRPSSPPQRQPHQQAHLPTPSFTTNLFTFAVVIVIALISLSLYHSNFLATALPGLGFRAGSLTAAPAYRSDDTSHTTASSMASSIRRSAPLVFPALTRHTATVIFVHGLGDTGAGWADAVELWRRSRKMAEVKFVLPNAPVIPISMNGGFPMPGWFDIKSLGYSVNALETVAHDEDERGILSSRDYFHSLIQEEISAGIPSERIVVGGFSQGGALSIISGLTAPVKIGGIVGLSSWLLLSQKFQSQLPEGNWNKDTPILTGHGDSDPLVPYELATATQKKLHELGFKVDLKTYRGMAHSACMEEFQEVQAFLEARLSPQGS